MDDFLLFEIKLKILMWFFELFIMNILRIYIVFIQIYLVESVIVIGVLISAVMLFRLPPIHILISDFF